MEKFIITAFIVCIIISTVLLLFVIVSVSKNKNKQINDIGVGLPRILRKRNECDIFLLG